MLLNKSALETLFYDISIYLVKDMLKFDYFRKKDGYIFVCLYLVLYLCGVNLVFINHLKSFIYYVEIYFKRECA